VLFSTTNKKPEDNPRVKKINLLSSGLYCLSATIGSGISPDLLALSA
jgi:hypothetical protein